MPQMVGQPNHVQDTVLQKILVLIQGHSKRIEKGPPCGTQLVFIYLFFLTYGNHFTVVTLV
jgi:hypothetical protein